MFFVCVHLRKSASHLVHARVAELADALDLGTDRAFFFLFTNLSESHLKPCFHLSNRNQQSQMESGRIGPRITFTGTIWAQSAGCDLELLLALSDQFVWLGDGIFESKIANYSKNKETSFLSFHLLNEQVNRVS